MQIECGDWYKKQTIVYEKKFSTTPFHDTWDDHERWFEALKLLESSIPFDYNKWKHPQVGEW